MSRPDLERIRGLREDQDLTQKRLAAILNISQRTYSHYENGTRGIPADILASLADHYGCSIDYLYGRTQKKEINR